jgi:hypothetical protein
MQILQNLHALVLAPFVHSVRLPGMAADQAVARLLNGQATLLGQVLQTACTGGWNGLEIALAGDAWWKRAGSGPGVDASCRRQVQTFLDAFPLPELAGKTRFRQQVLRELRLAREKDLLSPLPPQTDQLVGTLVALAPAANPVAGAAEKALIASLAMSFRQEQYPNLAWLLEAQSAHGLPVMVEVGRALFRQQADRHQDLARALGLGPRQGRPDARESALICIAVALTRFGSQLEQLLESAPATPAAPTDGPPPASPASKVAPTPAAPPVPPQTEPAGHSEPLAPAPEELVPPPYPPPTPPPAPVRIPETRVFLDPEPIPASLLAGPLSNPLPAHDHRDRKDLDQGPPPGLTETLPDPEQHLRQDIPAKDQEGPVWDRSPFGEPPSSADPDIANDQTVRESSVAGSDGPLASQEALLPQRAASPPLPEQQPDELPVRPSATEQLLPAEQGPVDPSPLLPAEAGPAVPAPPSFPSSTAPVSPSPVPPAPASKTAPAASPSEPGPPPGRKPRRSWLLPAIGVGCMLVAGTFFVLSKKNPKGPPREDGPGRPQVQAQPNPNHPPRRPFDGFIGPSDAPRWKAAQQPVQSTLQPPEFKEEQQPINLGGKVDDVAVGGGGRYLILRMPESKRLVIFDVNQTRIVDEIRLAEPGARFTAGIDKLLVAYSGAHRLDRYNLRTLTREAEGQLPAAVASITMGSASHGPFLISTWESRQAGLSWADSVFYDLTTLRPVRIPIDKEVPYISPANIRASADGRTFLMTEPDGSPVSLVLSGTGGTVSRLKGDAGLLLPGPAGRMIYGDRAVYTSQLEKRLAASPGTHPFLPAVQGDLFVEMVPRSSGPGKEAGLGDLRIYLPGEQKPALTVHDVAGIGENDSLTRDKRVLWLPAARLIISIPPGNGSLILRRFDVEAELRAVGKTLPRTSP